MKTKNVSSGEFYAKPEALWRIFIQKYYQIFHKLSGEKKILKIRWKLTELELKVVKYSTVAE